MGSNQQSPRGERDFAPNQAPAVIPEIPEFPEIPGKSRKFPEIPGNFLLRVGVPAQDSDLGPRKYPYPKNAHTSPKMAIFDPKIAFSQKSPGICKMGFWGIKKVCLCMGKAIENTKSIPGEEIIGVKTEAFLHTLHFCQQSHSRKFPEIPGNSRKFPEGHPQPSKKKFPEIPRKSREFPPAGAWSEAGVWRKNPGTYSQKQMSTRETCTACGLHKGSYKFTCFL